MLKDFSSEHLLPDAKQTLMCTIDDLNYYRAMYLDQKAKGCDTMAVLYWRQIIQLLPSSYNQKRTMGINYEALSAMYHWRHDHKLDEWKTLCKWMTTLPNSEIITLKEAGE